MNQVMPALVESVTFTEVDQLPPFAEIQHGDLLALSLSANTTTFTHGLHRFPAKFIPQIPGWALDNFGTRSSVVVDPFMGSGTTLVEGLLRGGTTIGIDIDPLAQLIAQAKVANLDHDQMVTLGEELAGHSRVLNEDQVRVSKRFRGSGRQVAEIADRRCNDVQSRRECPLH